MTVLVPIPMLVWGGSPKRILKSPEGLSGEESKAIVRYDRFLHSNSSDSRKMHEAGELSWIDVPGVSSSKRYLIFSMLHEEPGSRPVWFFFCLIIGRDAWQSIGSHRRLLKGMGYASSISLFDFFMSWGSEMSLNLTKVLPADATQPCSTFPPTLRMKQEEALLFIEKRLSFAEERAFSQYRLAWNPASLSGEWTCVIQTTDVTVPILKEQPLGLNASPDKSNRLISNPIPNKGRNKGGKWRKIFFSVFCLLLSVHC